MISLPSLITQVRRMLVPAGVAAGALLLAWGGVRVGETASGTLAWAVFLLLVAVVVRAVWHLVLAQTPLARRDYLESAIVVGLGGMAVAAAWITRRADAAAIARAVLLLAALHAGAVALRARSLTTAAAVLATPALLLLSSLILGPASGIRDSSLVVAFLMLACVVAAFAAVACGARGWSADSWLGVLFIVGGVKLALYAVVADSGVLTFASAVAATLVLAPWVAACAAFAMLLRALGAGIGTAVILPAFLAATLLAFPVTVVPLQRGLQTPGTARSDVFVAQAAYACPTMGVLNAAKDNPPFSWAEGTGNRVMYRLTTVGQNTAWPSVRWLTQTCLFALVAALLSAVAWGAGQLRRAPVSA